MSGEVDCLIMGFIAQWLTLGQDSETVDAFLNFDTFCKREQR